MRNSILISTGPFLRWDRGYRWYFTQYCRLLVVPNGGTGGTTMVAFRAVRTNLRTRIPPVPPGSTTCLHQNPV
jgi:hypothetical protein